MGVLRSVLDRAYDRVARTAATRSTRRSWWCSTRRPTSPPLPDLDALAATAAGHGVQLVTVWHDLAQITARLRPEGRRRWSTTTGPSSSSPGISDPSTLDHASHLIGDEELALPATTSGGRGGPSTTHSPTVRRLAPPDALRRIPPGAGVLVYRDLPPVRLHLRTWFDDPQLRDRVGEHPATGGLRPGPWGRPGARAGSARRPGRARGGAAPHGGDR